MLGLDPKQFHSFNNKEESANNNDVDDDDYILLLYNTQIPMYSIGSMHKNGGSTGRIKSGHDLLRNDRTFANTADAILDVEFYSEFPFTLSGEVAFKLHATYGFPLDLTQDVCRERGVEVDVDGFNTAMEKEKSQSI